MNKSILTWRISRKQYECLLCAGIIRKGENYLNECHYENGKVLVAHIHWVCVIRANYPHPEAK
jgi:hypothetical protein